MPITPIQYPSFADVFAVTGDYRNTTEPVQYDDSTALPVQVTTGLVDFIPRVPKGFTFYKHNFQVEGNNEVQLVGFIGGPSSGSWTMAFNGSAPTAAIPFNTDSAGLQTKLAALSTIGVGNVSVIGPVGGDWYVEFKGTLGNANQPLLTANSSSLVGATVGVSTDTPGRPVVLRDTAINLDPVFNARIWEGQLSTIDAFDTPGFTLPANTAEIKAALAALSADTRKVLSIGEDLVYDVRHRAVVFARSEQAIADYSFTAPAVGANLILTSVGLPRGTFQPRPDIPPA